MRVFVLAASVAAATLFASHDASARFIAAGESLSPPGDATAVQYYERPRFSARERYRNRRFERMLVEDDDGYFYLPGIESGRRGTVIRTNPHIPERGSRLSRPWGHGDPPNSGRLGSYRNNQAHTPRMNTYQPFVPQHRQQRRGGGMGQHQWR